MMYFLLINYVLYLILALLGATYGLHRYWSHKMGKRRIWFEWLSLSCALCIGVYKPLGWVGIHRLHHKYSDTIKDPHSPKYQGAWNVLLSKWNKPVPISLIRDVVNNERIKFFQRYGKYLIWIVILLSPITILFGYIGIGILNYFGHKSGGPSNVWWINLFAPGEGNHENHHSESKRFI